jgi:hypothetical protein
MAAARIRQAVIAARDLDAAVTRLRAELGLGEPYADPAVAVFGLRNAVFALGDTFLEVVSPLGSDDASAAGRLLERRGADCGYMVMFQVDDLAATRARAAEAGVRAVFEVALEDIEEVHLHPAEIGGAIVSASTPAPPEAWRWGGPDWSGRAAGVSVAGVTVAVAEPALVRARWERILGPLPSVTFVADPGSAGVVEIALDGGGRDLPPVQIGGVRLVFGER